MYNELYICYKQLEASRESLIVYSENLKQKALCERRQQRGCSSIAVFTGARNALHLAGTLPTYQRHKPGPKTDHKINRAKLAALTAARWSENVVWQFFRGMVYYESHLSCDASQIVRVGQLLGAQGVEKVDQHGGTMTLPAFCTGSLWNVLQLGLFHWRHAWTLLYLVAPAKFISRSANTGKSRNWRCGSGQSALGQPQPQ
jgi:hypothetical protein